jgi:tight adherence protein C
VIFLAIVALTLGGIALTLIVWGALVPRTHAAARVRDIGQYGFPGEEQPAPQRERRRSGATDVALRMSAAAARRFGSSKYEERLARDLISAGVYKLTARTVLGYQTLIGVAFGTLIVLAGLGNPFFTAFGAIVVGAIAAITPGVLVRRRARMRKTKVDRALPDLIDMIVITIEGGLGFAASLQAASIRTKGPLGEELMLTMQQQRMGRGLNDSLRELLGRMPTENMHAFVRSVTQGETLGVSIGTIMRNLANEMRVRRRQAAQERAQRAPVKMLFPLIFLMFPALGVVILGPALFEITEKLGST